MAAGEPRRKLLRGQCLELAAGALPLPELEQCSRQHDPQCTRWRARDGIAIPLRGDAADLLRVGLVAVPPQFARRRSKDLARRLECPERVELVAKLRHPAKRRECTNLVPEHSNERAVGAGLANPG